MAIFHLSVKMVTRSKGQSAVAKAAYNARDVLENAETGEVHDYHQHKGKVFAGLFVPEGAPAWAHDRQELWSGVERRETRKNSQLAREIEVSLPHELTDEQRQWLVQDFVREQFVRKGLAVDVAIHTPDRKGDERNYHAHLLITTRYLTPEGFGAKAVELNNRAQLGQWREQWAQLVNRHLERHGHDVRVDHRSLKDQGIDREPGQHIGVHAMAMERKGLVTERGEEARAIAERNQTREVLTAELHGVEAELRALEAAQANEQAREAAQATPAATSREAEALPRSLDASLAAFHAAFGTQEVAPTPTEVHPELSPAAAYREERRQLLDEARQRLGIPAWGASRGLDDLAATASRPLMVASDVAGKAADKLVDVVEGLLDSLVAPAPQKRLTPAELVSDPAARRAHYAQQAEVRRTHDALDRMAEAVRRGRAISRSDVQAMPYAELANIKEHGDDRLLALIKAREEERRREYGGRTRER